MRSLLRRFETFNKWCATGGGIILMIAAIVTTYDVFCRFLFNNPTIWALETAQYCLIYGTFLGGAYAFKKDLYIRVDIITNMLSQKNQDKLRFIGYIITFAVFVIIARYSTKYALFCYSKGWTQNTPMRTPMWIPLAVIPFGSIIISFQNLLLMLNYFFKKIF